MFNKRIKIKELLAQDPAGQQVTVMGWVRTFRNNQFIALNDGSTNNNLQVVVELGKFPEEQLKRITSSASLRVTGIVEPSLGKGQKMDLKAHTIDVLGDSDAGAFGPYLGDLLQQTGLATVRLEYKTSSGLARPDFFNWPEFMHQIVPQANPDIVVVTFGGNDAQGLSNPDKSWVVAHPPEIGRAHV